MIIVRNEKDADCIGKVVEGDLVIRGISKDIFFPLLRKVTGNLRVVGHPALAEFTAPRLATVGGDFQVYGNRTLGIINTPELVSVGSVQISLNDKLPLVNFSSLESAGDFVVHGNKSLASISARRLVSIEQFNVSGNDSLEEINIGSPKRHTER